MTLGAHLATSHPAPDVHLSVKQGHRVEYKSTPPTNVQNAGLQRPWDGEVPYLSTAALAPGCYPAPQLGGTELSTLFH